MAQFVDGTVGMGYGAFLASLLITMGLYPAIASASVHTAEVFTTLIPMLLALGFISAFMDAVGGGGWGPIATPGLILTGDHEARKVVGSINMVEFFVTTAEVLTFIIVLGPEQFRWDIILTLLIGGAIAAPMAAFLCKRLPHKALGMFIGLALIGFNVRTLVLSILR